MQKFSYTRKTLIHMMEKFFGFIFLGLSLTKFSILLFNRLLDHATLTFLDMI